MLDNSDWDWNSTEQIVTVGDMAYTNGNFVKLAVLRQGAQFYFLCNDSVVIQYATFNVFSEIQKAGVGFRCFSTPMLVKDYYATDDAAVIDEKIAQFAQKINGETFGSIMGYITTSGWDLSGDRGEDPVAVQSSGGDQYAYFKYINSTSFYAEIDLTVTKDLGDPYPKFGLAARVGSNTFFFYIDGSMGYNAINVGYVWRNAANNDWVWNDAAQSTSVAGLKYTDGEYTKLGMLREGNTFKLYVNGQLVFTVTDVAGFGETDNCVVSVLSFTTGITVKDYFATTDSTKYPA